MSFLVSQTMLAAVLATVLSALLSAAAAQEANETLVFVTQVYRHGARYPYPDQGFWNAAEQEPNEKQLSPTGIRQQYVLGKLMRERYID